MVIETFRAREAMGDPLPPAHMPDEETPPEEKKETTVVKGSYDWRTILVVSALFVSTISFIVAIAMFQPFYAVAFGLLSVVLGFATYFVHEYTKLKGLSEQVECLEANNRLFRQTNFELQVTSRDLRITSHGYFQQLIVFRQETERLNSQIVELEQQRFGLQDERERLGREVTRLENAMNELLDDSAFSAKLKVLGDINRNISEANEELGRVSERCELHHEKFAQEQEKLEEITGALRKTEEALQEREQNLREIEQRIRELFAEKQNLEERVRQAS